MQKYYYHGIPLSKYCQENGINCNSIISGISRKKKNSKFKNYSEQEIVDMVVDNYGKSIKYMYKGITLNKYCVSNNININTIYDRINKLKEKNPNLTNEELVRLAIDEYDYNNIKYYYNGVPLVEYCKNNQDISYSLLTDYIRRKKEENPNLSDEQIINLYLSKNHNKYRYYYHGIPLKIYCEKNNINYHNIINYIFKHKDKEKYNNLNDNELIEEIMNEYQPFTPKYLYKNMTLHQYCQENDLSYSGIVSYINNKKSKANNLDLEKLIDEAIEIVNRYGIIYYYKGMPLKDYCSQNNLNVKSIRGSIWSKRKISDAPLQEIVNECVESYKANNLKYFYNGEPLIQFCNKIGISYNTIIDRYLKANKNIPIEVIVDDYINNPINRKKYYFDNMTLSKFCNKNEYSYFAIYQRIKRLEKQEIYDNDIARIKNSIDEYIKKIHIKNINETFKNLEKMKVYNPDEIKNICYFLKINYDCVLELIEKDFSYIQAINMIWYFNDSKDQEDNKILTDKKIDELFLLINKISKSTNINTDKFRLYDLIGLYKSKLYDTRSEILNKQRKHIHKIVYNMCDIYGIKIQSNIVDDFSSELKLIFLEVIENICLNTEGQMIKFIDLTLKGNLRRYIESYKKNIPSTSLDNFKFSDNKNKKIIDTIADPNNQFEELDNSVFSSTMMQALSNLSQENVLFIMLKFQENYTDNELAEYFKINIDEVKEKEVEILSLLKDNSNIHVLKKSIN